MVYLHRPVQYGRYFTYYLSFNTEEEFSIEEKALYNSWIASQVVNDKFMQRIDLLFFRIASQARNDDVYHCYASLWSNPKKKQQKLYPINNAENNKLIEWKSSNW